MNMIQRLKNKKGFTLVELIVVIVIIAILTAVTVPMLTKYVKDAKESAKLAAVDVISTAAQTAAASVLGGLAENSSGKKLDFKDELKAILPKNKYKVNITTSDTEVTIFVGAEKSNKIVTIIGTGFFKSANPLTITDIVASGDGW